VWGALHGLYLWAEKTILYFRNKKTAKEDSNVVISEMSGTREKPMQKTFRNFLLAMLTFFFINVTWVFFRAQDFGTAWRLLTSMFYQAADAKTLLLTMSIVKICIITMGLIGFHWMMRDTRVLTVVEKMPWWLLAFIWALILILLILSQESSSSFIYFQF
jgi:alginate O-acetyltransferase complex protein AlgI